MSWQANPIIGKSMQNGLLKDKALIDGQWTGAEDGSIFDVLNPATGGIVGAVPDMGAADAVRAIEAASRALAEWRARTAKERSGVLRRWFDLLTANANELAALMTLEQGKPLSESLGEVTYGASFVEWFAEEAKRVYGDLIPAPRRDSRISVLKQPIGVVAAITPWNFPIAMITRKVAPAMAAGCTIVVKPAEDTPLSALAIAELAVQAGVPPGVLNIVTSKRSAEVGEILTTHPIVKKVSFTGSTRVGKLLMQQAAGTVKRVGLELGGNAPFIVFDDADLDAAVAGAMASKYRNAGQTCVCANRLLVQDGIYHAFVEKLTIAVKALKMGNGMEPGVNVGPLINRAATDKVARLVSDAVSKGAVQVVGGRISADAGNFFEPTILTNVTTKMDCVREEIFGPVAPVIRFTTEEDAIALANATPYGLSAYFFSRDIGRITRVTEALEVGMVGVNEGIISTEVAPFGGIKESGLGREGSKYGIDDYLEMKYVCTSGVSA
ncbi:NAD-dependent succinate-semialdehyde dehydrogenase [Paraburkholderia tropica]|uniref:NAD-dependent succinate-semialdehyde dehydrogenase n=1 Tax=Paraburkholderia tropica TaxID=92647 RepID=UPI002AB70A9A|nr:NAD-dependent succinate-semialdehyde dehydrogenase [Paraburkholderia tropica]